MDSGRSYRFSAKLIDKLTDPHAKYTDDGLGLITKKREDTFPVIADDAYLRIRLLCRLISHFRAKSRLMQSSTPLRGYKTAFSGFNED